jgi:hypothetical protein
LVVPDGSLVVPGGGLVDPGGDIGHVKAIRIAQEFWLGRVEDGFRGIITYESAGEIPSYSIEISLVNSGTPAGGRGAAPIAQVEVAKSDGFVLWAMEIPNASDPDSEITLSHTPYSDALIADGEKAAKEFLSQRSATETALAYSRYEGDSAVYVFTPVASGIRDYTRQIIVQVDLIEMRVIGYEGSQYYRNRLHAMEAEDRDPIISRELLKSFLSTYLYIEEINLAFIYNDWGKGILAWEVAAKVEKERFFLYYNCTNGAEEKIIRIPGNPVSRYFIN